MSLNSLFPELPVPAMAELQQTDEHKEAGKAAFDSSSRFEEREKINTDLGWDAKGKEKKHTEEAKTATNVREGKTLPAAFLASEQAAEGPKKETNESSVASSPTATAAAAHASATAAGHAAAAADHAASAAYHAAAAAASHPSSAAAAEHAAAAAADNAAAATHAAAAKESVPVASTVPSSAAAAGSAAATAPGAATAAKESGAAAPTVPSSAAAADSAAARAPAAAAAAAPANPTVSTPPAQQPVTNFSPPQQPHPTTADKEKEDVLPFSSSEGIYSMWEQTDALTKALKNGVAEAQALKKTAEMSNKVRGELVKDVAALSNTLEEEQANLGVLTEYEKQQDAILKAQLGYLTPITNAERTINEKVPTTPLQPSLASYGTLNAALSICLAVLFSSLLLDI